MTECPHPSHAHATHARGRQGEPAAANRAAHGTAAESQRTQKTQRPSGFRSGCSRSAAFLQARLMSSCVVASPFCSPSSS